MMSRSKSLSRRLSLYCPKPGVSQSLGTKNKYALAVRLAAPVVLAIILAGPVALGAASPSARPASFKVVNIKYGETAREQITATTRQINFKFSGRKGDVFAIEADAPAEYWGPTVTVFHSNGTQWRHNHMSLMAVIPHDDTYTIVVKPSNPSETGLLEVKLRQIPAIEVGQDVSDVLVASSNNRQQYVIRNSDGKPLTLHYQRVTGHFGLRVTVATLNANSGELETIALMAGASLDSGSMSFNFDSASHEALLLQLSVEEGRARYRVRLEADE